MSQSTRTVWERQGQLAVVSAVWSRKGVWNARCEICSLISKVFELRSIVCKDTASDQSLGALLGVRPCELSKTNQTKTK